MPLSYHNDLESTSKSLINHYYNYKLELETVAQIEEERHQEQKRLIEDEKRLQEKKEREEKLKKVYTCLPRSIIIVIIFIFIIAIHFPSYIIHIFIILTFRKWN